MHALTDSTIPRTPHHILHTHTALNTNRVMAQRALRRTEAETRVLAVEHGAGSGRDFTWGVRGGVRRMCMAVGWCVGL